MISRIILINVVQSAMHLFTEFKQKAQQLL